MPLKENKCLFTNIILGSKNEIEHTIPRGLGGRLKSRTVTSGAFNVKSSSFDKLFIDQYKLIMHTLAPILPREFNPGAIPTTAENGWKLIQENGVISLKKMEMSLAPWLDNFSLRDRCKRS